MFGSKRKIAYPFEKDSHHDRGIKLAKSFALSAFLSNFAPLNQN